MNNTQKEINECTKLIEEKNLRGISKYVLEKYISSLKLMEKKGRLNTP
jgi:hypothetical protein